MDKLIFKDEYDITTFTTNKDEIEEKAIDHYCNIGKVTHSPLSYDSSSPLREPWKSIYMPINMASQENINKLNRLITIMDELQEAIKDLPTKKAAEPNKISYEIIKQLPLQILEVILSLFNYILINEVTSEQFKLALLYPIPKPTWWNYDINHTRPIILSDCFHKLLVKIINS
ncbi:hypothetical protein RhiirA1_515779 [Rhizophagus irregularis]|uniref:Uncharacterized protein n=1 Tax=Rhizophagus irregularis TaxID=588596 RepID=A0A2N0RNQ5_9GLOM|nr:hypothetical protein RhiirA1_515779 [Rhizophagus irregularis]